MHPAPLPARSRTWALVLSTLVLLVAGVAVAIGVFVGVLLPVVLAVAAGVVGYVSAVYPTR